MVHGHILVNSNELSGYTIDEELDQLSYYQFKGLCSMLLLGDAFEKFYKFDMRYRHGKCYSGRKVLQWTKIVSTVN
jgi:hypothetical protein